MNTRLEIVRGDAGDILSYNNASGYSNLTTEEIWDQCAQTYERESDEWVDCVLAKASEETAAEGRREATGERIGQIGDLIADVGSAIGNIFGRKTDDGVKVTPRGVEKDTPGWVYIAGTVGVVAVVWGTVALVRRARKK